ALGSIGLKTARINHNIFVFTLTTMSVMAVAGQTSKVRNDSVAGLCQTVKQGRFAHIGPPDEGNNWLHSKFFVNPGGSQKCPRHASQPPTYWQQPLAPQLRQFHLYSVDSGASHRCATAYAPDLIHHPLPPSDPTPKVRSACGAGN